MKIKLTSALTLLASIVSINTMANPSKMYYDRPVELKGLVKIETITPTDPDGKALKPVKGIPMFYTDKKILTTYKESDEFQDFPEFTTDTYHLAFIETKIPKKNGCYIISAEPYGKHSPYHYTYVMLAVNKIKPCK